MNRNKVFELFPGAKLGIARVRPIGSLKKLSSFLLCAAFTLCPAVAAQAPVFLGSAAPFGVLAGTSVTNSGFSVINGDLGISPGTSVTGFPPGKVIGTIYTPNLPTTGNTVAQHAQASLTIAYNDAAGRGGAFTNVNAADLAGLTLTPGLYKSHTTISIAAGGKLYLKGKGVYIFQIGTGLTVNQGASIVLEGGAQAVDIFWQVGSLASLGTGASFAGTIMAGTAVTMGTNATLNGRALAKAEVTLLTNTLTVPGGGGGGGHKH